jgi:hypothetical protein
MAGPIDEVVRELLVRRLDAWGPAALQRSRRATFLQAYGAGGTGTAEAALRVFDEFTDLLRGRRLSVVVVAPDPVPLKVSLDAVYRELDAPSTLGVHTLPGDLTTVPVALRAAEAAGAPVFGFLDASSGPAPTPEALAALAAGKPGEVLVVLGPDARAGFAHRDALTAAGFPLVADVELVGDDRVALVAFATSQGKNLDAFKDAMWAVDEYAGVRYRDPRDPEAHLLDISLRPHPGPLRRELLAHLATVGSASVADLRRFTVSETVYRAADTTSVVTALLKAGQITRSPEAGRLSGDVLIAKAG